MMMYDELILRLKDAAEMSDALAVLLPHSGNATAKLYREAADAIEELIAERDAYCKAMTEEHNKAARLTWEYRWIPVTERLPEEDGKYLTAYKSVLNPPITWIRVCWFAKNLRKVDKYEFPKKKPGFYESDSEYGYFEVSGITHWMPLPEPPMDGES